MKTITKISVQQNNERYNLFLDEEFYCGITEETLIKLGLKKGMKVDEAKLQLLIREETNQKCFHYGMYLLERHSYFKKALITKMQQKEYDEEAISFAINELIKYRYLDDERLTEAFIKDKKKFSKKGPRYIASALMAKGIEKESIDEALEQCYEEEEALENCKSLINKKLEYYKRKTSSSYELKGKLYAFLAQRGYRSDTIKKSIEQILSEDKEG